MKILISLVILLLVATSFADDRYNSIFQRQELLHKSYKQVYLDLTDINRKESLKSWFRLLLRSEKGNRAFKKSMWKLVQPIPGKDYRELLFYYTVTGQADQANQLVGLYLLSVQVLLDNFINNPQSQMWNPRLSQLYKRYISEVTYQDVRAAQKCFADYTKDIQRGFNLDNASVVHKGTKRCISRDPQMRKILMALDELFIREDYYGAPFPTSFAGYIPGNKVELHNEIPLNPYVIRILGEQLFKIENVVQEDLQKKYSEMTVEDFKSLMDTPEAAVENLFTRKEGFKNSRNHPSLLTVQGERLGTFGEIIDAVKNAKESVLVDVFWLGGTIGMNMAKELMKKTIENPDFEVFIISDNENKFAYGTQLDIVTNYMTAFSQKFTEKNFYFAPARLNLKRTALPEFMDLLFTDSVVDGAQNNASLKPYLEKDGFHLLAKSDHTKTFVIDGKNPTEGVAYVGSKNWTDASGGVAIDEVAEVRGPAVAVILNSFYYDVLEAYKTDELNTIAGHLAVKTQSGSKHDRVQKLISGIDVIDRVSSSSVNNINVEYVPYKDGSVIAPGQNNIYGTEMSPVEQNIQAILGAKKQILVDDQFLWDPSIIEALKVAKLKHGVEIYVTLNPMQGVDSTSDVAAHIPNNLFVPELVEIGIPVKWKIVEPELKKALLADKEKHGQLLSPEFHIKSITVDGVMKSDWESCQTASPVVNSNEAQPVLITGSANKDILTMSGGFREYQVVAFDQGAVVRHDCLFWSRWHNQNSTESTDGLDFEIPEEGKSLGITDKRRFLNAVRMILFAPYNFTKDFF